MNNNNWHFYLLQWLRVHKVFGQKDRLCPIKIRILTFLFSWLSFFSFTILCQIFICIHIPGRRGFFEILLIAASKIVKSFQTFPDISTGIGRWYQSDHKYIGLSAVTTGYYQTTMDQGAFMDKIVKRRKGPSQSTTSQNTQKRKCQKILIFRHFFKETD